MSLLGHYWAILVVGVGSEKFSGSTQINRCLSFSKIFCFLIFCYLGGHFEPFSALPGYFLGWGGVKTNILGSMHIDSQHFLSIALFSDPTLS